MQRTQTNAGPSENKMTTFSNITAGQISYLGQLYYKAITGKIIHRKTPCGFYVESHELQVVFGAEYRKILEPYITCVDEDFDIKKTTKAYTFTERSIEAFKNLKPQQIVVKKRSNMDVEYEEKINMKALDEVISNEPMKDETRQQLILLRAQTPESGINIVTYKRISGAARGRRFASNISLQGIPDRIRKLIIDVSYTDIDMANSQPVLLEAFAKSLGLSSDNISNYILNREGILEKLQFYYDTSRKAAKQLMLQTMYGAGDDAMREWAQEFGVDQISFDESNKIIIPTFLRNFKKETAAIGKALMKTEDAAWISEYRRKRSNKGCAVFMQDIEAQCLESIETWCNSKGIKVMVLIHDGLIVEGVGYDFSECQTVMNNMLAQKYGIKTDIRLEKKSEVSR